MQRRKFLALGAAAAVAPALPALPVEMATCDFVAAAMAGLEPVELFSMDVAAWRSVFQPEIIGTALDLGAIPRAAMWRGIVDGRVEWQTADGTRHRAGWCI